MAREIIITVIGILVLFCMWMAIYDTNRFTVSGYEYKNSRIKKKVRAVVISDLHNKSYGKDNERLIQAVRAQKPDIILMTGDILNGRPNEKTDVALNLTAELAKEFPVYYGIGNHELRMRIYPEKYGEKYDEYISALCKMGVKVLSNESAEIGGVSTELGSTESGSTESGSTKSGNTESENGKSEIAGSGILVTGADIPRKFYKRFKKLPMDRKDLEELMGKPDKKYFNVMLAHNPAYFDAYAEYGTDLVLAGHVHGGIVRIPFAKKGVLSPNISFFPKYDGGEYTKDRTSMIVSRGLGVHTIPFRLFNPGDLVVVDFIPVK